jgi:hypothetical protein
MIVIHGLQIWQKGLCQTHFGAPWHIARIFVNLMAPKPVGGAGAASGCKFIRNGIYFVAFSARFVSATG